MDAKTDDLWMYSSFSVPTGHNGNYRSVCTKFCCLLVPSLCHHVHFFLSTNEIASLERMEKKVFPFDTKNFRNFQPKILANWKAPLLCKRLLDEARCKTVTVNGNSHNVHKSQIKKLGCVQVIAENTGKVQERM